MGKETYSRLRGDTEGQTRIELTSYSYQSEILCQPPSFCLYVFLLKTIRNQWEMRHRGENIRKPICLNVNSKTTKDNKYC